MTFTTMVFCSTAMLLSFKAMLNLHRIVTRQIDDLLFGERPVDAVELQQLCTARLIYRVMMAVSGIILIAAIASYIFKWGS